MVEVLTPSGSWSSYPPHKHDEDRPPDEVKLEEVYYRAPAEPAFAFQRLYSPQHDRRDVDRARGDVSSRTATTRSRRRRATTSTT